MKKFITLALAGATMTVAAGSAHAADTLQINSVSSVYNGSSAFTADITKSNYPTVSDRDVSISPQKVTGSLNGSAVSLFTYCVDLFEYSGAGTFEVVKLSDYVNATKYGQIAALISAHSAQSNVTTNSAVQLAIWEILYETSNSFSLTSGTLRASNIEDGLYSNNEAIVKSNAASFLADAKDGSPINLDISFYVAKSTDTRYTDGKQDLLFWTIKPAVPEPATWAMMILGMGAVGASMRRRKTSIAFA